MLKGLAEYLNMSLGDLIEGILLHNFEHKVPFSKETLAKIDKLREVYGLDPVATDRHELLEKEDWW